MKLKNKQKAKEIRNRIKQRKQIEENMRSTQIIKTITPEQIALIKKYNLDSISQGEMSKDDLIIILDTLFTIISNSSYLDEVLKMSRQNVSENWFDKTVDKDFIQEVLSKELELAKNSNIENIALKVCFWANRIAHHIESEIENGEKKHVLNDIYTTYFLDSKFNYDVLNSIDPNTNKLYPGIEEKLNTILRFIQLKNTNTPEDLHNIFLGIYLRNELWTMKQEMLKQILLKSQENKESTIRVTSFEEKEDLTISGSSTLRLIIRELHGVAPIIMHCNKEIIDDFLTKHGLSPIQIEQSEELIEFARKGKVGIHFVLDKYDREVLEYESENNPNADKLNKIMFRGEEDER